MAPAVMTVPGGVAANAAPAGRTPMRVLELIDSTDPGGAENVVLQLTSILRQRGWECTIGVPHSGWLREVVERLALPFVETSLSGSSFDIKYLLSIVHAIRAQGSQLVHTHLLGASVYGVLAARLAGVPAVCTFHGVSDVHEAERFRALKSLILSGGATRLVFVSTALKRELRVRLGLSTNKLEVINNGIDLSAFGRRSDSALRQELGIGPHAILVGAIGHGRPEKSYGTFVEAAALLKRGAGEWHFAVVGELDGGLQDQLRAMAARLDVADRLHLVGPRTDIGRVLNNLDAYVLTSTSEGFSLSTIEALACGVPVVATRCGGPEDILEHGVTGLLVDVEAPMQVADAVRRIVNDEVLRERLVTQGERTVRARYSVETMADAYMRLFKAATGHQ